MSDTEKIYQAIRKVYGYGEEAEKLIDLLCDMEHFYTYNK